ncbi:MAG: hypothetical protein JWQ97_600, partial [Phenylobacterium sp.]|nr:hypothetical protein [Phenylobacterium sp.]
MSRPARSARLGFSLFTLGLEAQTVIALRLMKLAGGGVDAQVEAQRMVAEKIDAAMVANTHLAAGLMSGSTTRGPRKAL